MQVQLLIDDIVRQTTVLVAQLSTAAGLRAPLSHIADQVFLELSRELEAQGVRRKVVADMFGLALRSYQLKLRRLSDPTELGQTRSLWRDIYDELGQGRTTRRDLERKFRTHPPKQIAAALQDMVGSGIAYCAGSGLDTLFGLTSEADRKLLSATQSRAALTRMAWYLVASGAAGDRAELLEQTRCSSDDLELVLSELLDGAQLWEQEGKLFARTFEIAPGDEQGWETAVCDHFRAVSSAIAAKVKHPRATPDDRIGGGTVSFKVHPDHPYADEVYALLGSVRTSVNEVWRRVAEYNTQTPPPDDCDRVTFYFGQCVYADTGEGPAAAGTNPQDL